MIRDSELPDVVDAAGRGEHWGLTPPFRACQPALLRHLRAQDAQAADDLASEVRIGVARGLGGFAGDEVAFRCWLPTIARRRLIDHRRRAARQRTDVVPGELLDIATGVGHGGDPARAVLARLGAQRPVEGLVAALPADQAEAVLLRAVGGLSVAEVGRIMHRSPGAVRVLCHRARRQLAMRVDDEVAVS